MKQRIFTLMTAIAICALQVVGAATLKGIVVDQVTGEPLLGATVIIKGTTIGAATGVDGTFELNVGNSREPLVVSYIAYLTQEVTRGELTDLKISLAPDLQEIASVKVVSRVNLETEVSLQQQRLTSNVAIENIGIREMSLKGLSNAEDGVKKMTGVSVASAGQIIVRGLGDRYSITTLNGQPIASPNPDNKLIPLDIFPSSAISSIQVSKVYNATVYADFAGAHIDIATKSNVYDKFLEFGVTLGGNTLTTGQAFYQMNNVSLFSKSSITDGAAALTKNFSQMSSYINENDVFETDFGVTKSTALPKMSANVAWGNNYKVGNQKFTAMLTGSIDNDYQTIEGATEASLRSDGSKRSNFTYDSYEQTLKLAALGTVGLTLRERDFIGYNIFYARNASNDFQDRRGWTYDVSDLVGISSVSNIYAMLNNQLYGSHYFGEDWAIKYSTSYSTTTSSEPDRRQVMYTDNGDGTYDIFKEDQNETMRYFAELEETSLSGQFATDFNFGDDNKNKLTFGVAYKTTAREFDSMNFYYNYGRTSSGGFVAPEITDTHDTSFLTYDNIGYGAGQISLTYERYPNDYYSAQNSVVSAFASTDFNVTEQLLLTAGLRLESSNQSVDYGTESATGLNSTIKANDLFPALNIRYKVGEKDQIRFAASRTITRPSFVEMAPFSYEPSYGAGIVKGNADIENAYNYNVDLRYEKFLKDGDMISVTGYYKYLDTPIERIQLLSTTDPYTSFDNADRGMAAGVEFEMRKAITKSLRMSANASYLFTNVNLSEGAQTNDSRMLQGASPYLVNVDLAYSPKMGGTERPLTLVLLYSLRGERIYSVGVDGLGDIMEKANNDLNFVASYKFNDKMSLKLEIDNLLNQDFVCEQIIPQNNNERIEVVHYEIGQSAKIGFSMKF